MNFPLDVLKQRAEEFADQQDREIWEFLGRGTDGAVWMTSRLTAVKVFEREESYQRERNAYLRLNQRNVTEIQGLTIPQMISRGPAGTVG